MKPTQTKNGLSSSGLELRLKSGWKIRSSDKEHKDTKSETVQGAALSIKDLMDKFTMGTDLTEHREGFYEESAAFEDEDMSKLQTLDIYERQTLLQAYATRYQNLLKQQREADRLSNDAASIEQPKIKSGEQEARTTDLSGATQEPATKGAAQSGVKPT